MIDIKLLEHDDFLARYKKDLQHRGEDIQPLERILVLYKERKQIQTRIDNQKHRQKQAGLEITQHKKQKKDAQHLVQAMQVVSNEVKELEKKNAQLLNQLNEAMSVLPNICDPEVPIGNSEADNKVVSRWGTCPEFDFTAREHFELGEKLQVLDFQRASRVTGSRFAFLRGGAARLERALMQFMMDLHAQKHGYEEIIPPFIVNNRSLFGTGQFPKFYEDVFHVEKSATREADRSGQSLTYHLVPTAEVPVTNFFSQEILSASQLPLSFVAFSPCFRSEAGSYGKDTQGLIRQHQFNKVELVKFVHPDESANEHERLTQHAERVLQLLELPYRKVLLCTKDLGFAALKCYDLEVWLPGQKAWREISSCSNFGDFQARRIGLRFRPAPKQKPRFVHTLNGSGLALGRTLIAIFENFQTADGSIKIPPILGPYMQGLTLISK